MMTYEERPQAMIVALLISFILLLLPLFFLSFFLSFYLFFFLSFFFHPTIREAAETSTAGAVPCHGTLINTNTREGFVALDKGVVVQPVVEQLVADVTSGAALANPALMNRFLLLTFADMKKYHFTYWFCFPALRPFDAELAAPSVPATQAFSAAELAALQQAVPQPRPAAFLVRRAAGDKLEVGTLADWPQFFASTPPAERILAVCDPSTSAEHPGWPLRNMLALCSYHFAGSQGDAPLTVLCYRESFLQGAEAAVVSLETSLVLKTKLQPFPDPPASVPNVKGWEKNHKQKLAPRICDLSAQVLNNNNNKRRKKKEEERRRKKKKRK